jgi:hypothetical protein
MRGATPEYVPIYDDTHSTSDLRRRSDKTTRIPAEVLAYDFAHFSSDLEPRSDKTTRIHTDAHAAPDTVDWSRETI